MSACERKASYYPCSILSHTQGSSTTAWGRRRREQLATAFSWAHASRDNAGGSVSSTAPRSGACGIRHDALGKRGDVGDVVGASRRPLVTCHLPMSVQKGSSVRWNLRQLAIAKPFASRSAGFVIGVPRNRP